MDEIDDLDRLELQQSILSIILFAVFYAANSFFLNIFAAGSSVNGPNGL